jgi:hypothetical protein
MKRIDESEAKRRFFDWLNQLYIFQEQEQREHERWLDQQQLKGISKKPRPSRSRTLAVNSAARGRLTVPCDDCRVGTSFSSGIGHHVIARDEVWRQAVRTNRTTLYRDCLETGLGRHVVVATPPEIFARSHEVAVDPAAAWRAVDQGKFLLPSAAPDLDGGEASWHSNESWLLQDAIC